ncbi:hypothetical protein CH253_08335 [Rhodococcus sp. 06-156-3C]|nr:hypothetical protein CH253_08335 [Rhodococcus sp. 06-156-3C]
MLTDGFIAERLALARWGLDACQELLENDPVNPSLLKVENGYQVHDFARHQSTKADIEAVTEARKAAGRRGGLAKAKQVLKQKSDKTYPETETETYIKDTQRTPAAPADVPETLSLDVGKSAKVAPQAEDNEGFERFWSEYPKRVGKGQARTAFKRALSKASVDVLVEGAKRYKALPGREDKYTKHASTWLNGEGWSDEMPEVDKSLSRVARGLWQGD